MTPASALYNYVHDLLAENPHLLAITRQLEQEDTADTAPTTPRRRVSGRRAATPTTQPAAVTTVTSTPPAVTGQNIGRNH